METDTFDIKALVSNKPLVMSEIKVRIEQVIDLFNRYDRIQLLGGIGLILIENLPTPDKVVEAQMFGNGGLKLDEEAEIVMEYAMNFGTALEWKSDIAPNDEVIAQLYQTLKDISVLYNLYDMPISEEDYDAWLSWMVHMNHIHVRGEGYAVIVEQVFDDLFRPHDEFFKRRLGFSFDTLKFFCTEIERYILSKIGTLYGGYLSWQRWKEDCEKEYGTDNDAIEKMLKDKPENGIMGSMADRSPDMFGDGPMHVLMYKPNDFGSSDKIFWIVPQNAEEKALYEELSCRLGENATFLNEGDYKGNIMSGMELYKKPLIKIGDKYFCFTPMLPHRNMIAMAENLLKKDVSYYDQHYRNNTDPKSRDQYMERKVADLALKMLPRAKIYSSVYYQTISNGKETKTELDVLCLTESATYIIEVKGHELSNADKVKIKGFKDKFKESVGKGSYQACRAENHIINEDAVFYKGCEKIGINPKLPVFKIVVTLQHFSSVIGHFNYMVKSDLMVSDYWNVWAISLFDLFVIADYIENEKMLIDYLLLHCQLQQKGIEFMDELDVYAHYLGGTLPEEIKNQQSLIKGGAEIFNAKYDNILCFA